MNGFREKNSNWKGGVRIDNGYRYIYQPDHPKATKTRCYIAEHVLVVEAQLGRYLLEGEQVHHKDGDKLNNDISNLEVLTIAEHNKVHAKVRQVVEIKCAFCGKISIKYANQVNTKKKQGQKDFYCDRSCSASHFGVGRCKK